MVAVMTFSSGNRPMNRNSVDRLLLGRSRWEGARSDLPADGGDAGAHHLGDAETDPAAAAHTTASGHENPALVGSNTARGDLSLRITR